MKDNPFPQKKQSAALQNPEDFVTCLSSNNSTEGCHKSEPEVCQPQVLPEFSPYHKKQAETLYRNVARLISLAPSPKHVGMLTLTFVDNVTDHHEASRRFNSFNSHYLKPSQEYGHWLLTKERQQRGAWHYHMIVICREDIKTGFSPQVYNWWLDQRNKGRRRRLNTGNDYLRELWEKNREATKKYRLGIPNLIPMLSNPEAMARYVGKYISKHLTHRKESDKGVRLIQTSQGWPKNSLKFSWNTENSKHWRRGVRYLANINGCPNLFTLQLKLGKRWAFDFYPEIVNHQKSIAEIEKEIPF